MDNKLTIRFKLGDVRWDTDFQRSTTYKVTTYLIPIGCHNTRVKLPDGLAFDMSLDVGLEIWENDGVYNSDNVKMFIHKVKLTSIDGHELRGEDVGLDEDGLKEYVKNVLTPSVSFESDTTDSIVVNVTEIINDYPF